MAGKSPTARSLESLREAGYIAEVVERWIPHTNNRKDLFGAIDIVAIHPNSQGILGVQATTAANASARVRKALMEPKIRVWIEAGGFFAVHGWRKYREGNREIWRPMVREITIDDLNKLRAMR